MVYIKAMWQFIVANVKCLLKKILAPKRFCYNIVLRFGKSVSISAAKKTKITLGKNVYVGDHSDIYALNGGKLQIGNGVHIGKRNMVICHDSIVISKGTIMAPDVKIYDHDHKMSGNKIETKKYVTSPVFIGEDCWIGANVVILRGTKIGNNCVVGAGCILKGEYPDNSIIIQKRQTVVNSR